MGYHAKPIPSSVDGEASEVDSGGEARTLIAAAVALADKGFRVLPLHDVSAGVCSCARGGDCPDTGKHPRLTGWKEGATTDAGTIHEWWARWPKANIGVALGGPSRVIVVDVDGPEGRAVLARLEARHGTLPATLTSRSGRLDGGEHRFFRVPESLDMGAIKGRKLVVDGAASKIDIKTTGGQVVAPPSLHLSGRRYAWTTDEGEAAPIAELPAWLYLQTQETDRPKPAAQAVPPSQPTGPRQAPAVPSGREERRTEARIRGHVLNALQGACDVLRSTPEGDRNNQANLQAYSVAGYLHYEHFTEAQLSSVLLQATRAGGWNRKDEHKTAEAIQNGIRDGRSARQYYTPPPDEAPAVPASDAPPLQLVWSNGRAIGSRPPGMWIPGSVIDTSEAAYIAALEAGAKGGIVPPVEQDAARSFEWLDASFILDDLPPIRWIVRDLQICPGRPAVLAGYGASGKTLALQSLAMAAATGRPAWGQFRTDRRMSVRHVDYEQGSYGTKKRYKRLCAGLDISREEVEDMVSEGRFGVIILPRIYLTDPDAEDVLKRSFDGVDLVLLDALRGATPGADENDSSVREYVDRLTRVSEQIGTAFLFLHHAGKTNEGQSDARQKLRGSSGIFDASGSAFVLFGERGEPKRVQHVKGAAEAEGHGVDDFYLDIQDVEIGGNKTAGVRVVCQSPEEACPPESPESKARKLQDKLLGVIRCDPGQGVGELKLIVGGNGSAVNGALEALERKGLIVVHKVEGSNAKRHYPAPRE